MKNQYQLFKQMALGGLDTMSHLLVRSKELISENLTEQQILDKALAPDMFSFKRQVQVYTDVVKGGVGRLSEVEIPKYEDNENTIDELIERVAKTKKYIESIPENTFANAENLKIKLPWFPEGLHVKASNYAENFLPQNSSFHLSMAYAILRNLGLNLSKQDYILGLKFEKDA